jgi:hypothetical protein
VTASVSGFLEWAPYEDLFTNHIVKVTANDFPFLSLRVENGCNLEAHHCFVHPGMQLNIHEVVPPLKKALNYLIVAQFAKTPMGLRPPNTLVSGGIRPFTVIKGAPFTFEAWRRFFPGKRKDYGEYLFLVHPEKTPHFSFGALVIHSGARKTFMFGIRIH